MVMPSSTMRTRSFLAGSCMTVMTWPRLASLGLAWLLVDDHVAEFFRPEQSRYPAHALRVAEADVGTGRHAVVHRLDGFAPRFVVEIDQHVAAKDHVDAPECAHEPRVHDVAL